MTLNPTSCMKVSFISLQCEALESLVLSSYYLCLYQEASDHFFTVLYHDVFHSGNKGKYSNRECAYMGELDLWLCLGVRLGLAVNCDVSWVKLSNFKTQFQKFMIS